MVLYLRRKEIHTLAGKVCERDTVSFSLESKTAVYYSGLRQSKQRERQGEKQILLSLIGVELGNESLHSEEGTFNPLCNECHCCSA